LPIERFKYKTGSPGIEPPNKELANVLEWVGISVGVVETIVSGFGTIAQAGTTSAGAATGSLGGPPGSALGAFVGYVLGGVSSDGAETMIGLGDFAATIVGDIAGGYTYIDPKSKAVVVGQSTVVKVSEQLFDAGFQASPAVDLGLNITTLTIDVADKVGIIEPFMEARISFVGEKPVLDLVFYDNQ
jgi:hypothetical protein